MPNTIRHEFIGTDENQSFEIQFLFNKETMSGLADASHSHYVLIIGLEFYGIPRFC